jgi:hypothetical protein
LTRLERRGMQAVDSMSTVSRSWLAALIALVLTLGGCKGSGCDLEVCFSGLVVTLDDSFKGPTVYDVNITEITPLGEMGPISHCTWAPNGIATDAGTSWGEGLRCQSVYAHSEQGNIEIVQYYQPKTIDITVSVDGVVVAQKMFSVSFTNENTGCGPCNHALVTMSLN